MDMHKSTEDLIARIDSAFADVRWPAAHNLVAHDPHERLTFKDIEEPHIINHFGGKRRDQFEQEVSSIHIEELISMSKHAIAYYLPCFLKNLLADRDDFGFTIGMISLLGNRAVNRGVNIWPDFTEEQRQAIFQTVGFVRQHIKSYRLGEFEEEYRRQLQEAGKYWS